MAMGKRRAAAGVAVHHGRRAAEVGRAIRSTRSSTQLLAEAGFDRWIERRCQQYYAQEEKRGQPSIPPGVYFRMLLVGYFEGIDSQRGIAWRCADSLSLRQFLGIPLDEATPDHSTLTNTRKRLPPEVFDEVFQFVLAIAAEKKLLVGQDGGRRQHDAGSQRGDEEHRAPRHGRGLEAVRHAADAGGRRDRAGARADGRRGPPLRQEAEEQEGLATTSGCRRPIPRAASRR